MKKLLQQLTRSRRVIAIAATLLLLAGALLVTPHLQRAHAAQDIPAGEPIPWLSHWEGDVGISVIFDQNATRSQHGEPVVPPGTRARIVIDMNVFLMGPGGFLYDVAWGRENWQPTFNQPSINVRVQVTDFDRRDADDFIVMNDWQEHNNITQAMLTNGLFIIEVDHAFSGGLYELSLSTSPGFSLMSLDGFGFAVGQAGGPPGPPGPAVETGPTIVVSTNMPQYFTASYNRSAVDEIWGHQGAIWLSSGLPQGINDPNWAATERIIFDRWEIISGDTQFVVNPEGTVINMRAGVAFTGGLIRFNRNGHGIITNPTSDRVEIIAHYRHMQDPGRVSVRANDPAMNAVVRIDTSLSAPPERYPQSMYMEAGDHVLVFVAQNYDDTSFVEWIVPDDVQMVPAPPEWQQHRDDVWVDWYHQGFTDFLWQSSHAMIIQIPTPARDIELVAVFADGARPPIDTQAAPSPWAAESIAAAIARGLVPPHLQAGYTTPITRAEFAALAVMLFETWAGRPIAGRTQFADTADADVQKMAYLGVVTGVGDNMFLPNAPITREQAALMLSRLSDHMDAHLPASIPPTFVDAYRISDWARDAVGRMQFAAIMGAMDGYGNFWPDFYFTREQAIATALRMFERFE